LAYALVKRAIDATTAATLLLLGAPFLLAVGLGVWLTIDRAVLFRQMRRGRGLVAFTLLKFQTLRDPIGPDGRWLADEERQTRFGRLLRRTRLDELPQLWNVLVGDMALVGPRPLVDRDLLALPDRGRARAAMRPGLTGWAQVNGGQILGPAEKHALDLWYLRHASLALDLRILWLTLLVVVRGERLNPVEVQRALAALEPVEAPA
jgi:lipopolysaccharide/colanic/teichoic acid biosynthesis glycosyltransferase